MKSLMIWVAALVFGSSTGAQEQRCRPGLTLSPGESCIVTTDDPVYGTLRFEVGGIQSGGPPPCGVVRDMNFTGARIFGEEPGGGEHCATGGTVGQDRFCATRVGDGDWYVGIPGVLGCEIR